MTEEARFTCLCDLTLASSAVQKPSLLILFRYLTSLNSSTQGNQFAPNSHVRLSSVKNVSAYRFGAGKYESILGALGARTYLQAQR